MSSTRHKVESLAHELKQIKDLICGNKVKHRKDGLCRLEAVLAVESNLIIIDALTLGVAPDRQEDAFACQYASWKSILSYMIKTVEDGLARSLKKGQVPDATMSRVVRQVVNKATSKRRTAYVNVLEPCADMLMEHLSIVMEQTHRYRDESQVYNDYSMTLKFLLENGDYTNNMDYEDFQRTLRPLVGSIMSKAAAALQDNAASSFVAKDLTMVRTVLQYMKYDIDPALMESLCQVFRAFGDGMDLHSWTPRIVNEVIGLCVYCLVDSRGDYTTEFQNVCRMFHHSCMLLIRGGNIEGREVGMQYFFAALNLDLLDGDCIQDLLEWYQRYDLESAWQRSPESSEYMFNSYQSLLASLFAEIEIAAYRKQVHVPGPQGTQNRHGSLIANVISCPTKLGPVACEFISRHGMYMEKEDFVGFCAGACQATETMLKHSFVAGSVKPDVIWMMRLVYSVAVIAGERSDIESTDCRTLGSSVSQMIQQYGVLCSYQITKDLVKHVLIESLPKFHEIIVFLDPENFEKELVSEAPSSLSLSLFNYIVKYKRFASHSGAENKIFIDWICESLALHLPSGDIASSLCVVLYGGVEKDSAVLGQEVCANEDRSTWLKKDSIHQMIENLPPVRSWSLFNMHTRNEPSNGSTHRSYNIRSSIDLNIHLASNLTQKFHDALATDDIAIIFNTAATGVRILWHVSKGSGNYTCWKDLSEYFEVLNRCISKCTKMTADWIRNNATLHEGHVHNIVSFFHSLSALSGHSYGEYHEGLKKSLKCLPSLHAALNYSMSIPEVQDIVLDSQQVDGGMTIGGSPNPLKMSILTAQKNGSSNVTVPMLQWFLKAFAQICAWNATETLQDIQSLIEYFKSKTLYLPLTIRKYSALIEAHCIAHLLRQNPLDSAEKILSLQFSQTEQGTYTYDTKNRNLLLKPEIFETVLGISHKLLVVDGYQCFCDSGEQDDALLCMESLANTIVSLAFLLADEEFSTSKQRIHCARLVIDLFEISRKIESNLIAESMFDSIVEWLASSVLDARFSVRIAVSNLFPNLLDIFDDPSTLFHSVLQLMPIQSNDDDETVVCVESDKDAVIRTILLTLGKVALKVDKLELICVTNLLQEMSTENAGLNDTILNTLTWLGNSLGYKSGKHYFEIMSREIAVNLLSSTRKLVPNVEKFILACTLLDLGDIPAKEAIFATLLYFRSINGIRGLLNVLKESSPESLVKKSMADIYAIHYHLSESNDAESLVRTIQGNLKKILNAFNCTTMDTKSVARAASSDILVHIIGTPRMDPGCQPMATSGDDVGTILHIVDHLSVNDRYRSQTSPIDTMDLLIRIKEKLYAFRHPRHKSLAMKATKCAILSIENSLDNPGILRQVLAIISSLIKVRATAEQASSLLKDIILFVMNLSGSLGNGQASLVATVGNSVASLLSNLCDTYEAIHYNASSELLSAIKLLTCKAPASLQAFNVFLDPRLEKIEDNDLKAFVAKTAHSSTLDAQVSTFSEISQHLSSSTRCAYIQMLRGLMSKCNIQTGRRIVSETTLWKIVTSAAAKEGDEKFLDFAGELVSYFGPLDPHVLTFKPKQKHSSGIHGHQTGREYSKNALEEEVYYRAIILLSDFLVDESSVVSSEAFRILQVLLSTQAGHSVFNSLDPLIQDYLNMFIQCDIEIESSEDDLMISNRLYAQDLWSLDGVSYDEWVTRVGSEILSSSQKRVLRNCKKLASIQAKFCEIMLPLAFADLATSKTVASKEPDMSKLLGECITLYVFPFCKSCPGVMNVLLSIFHSLRIFIHQKDSHSDCQGPDQWKTMCWLDIDYLDICEACIHARSLYSALIFVERWQQDYQETAPDSSVRRCQNLLLEIYTLLPEPDGLYAVARSNNALSQLRKFEREGDWSKALVISDVALQLLQENSVSGSFMDISKQEAINSTRKCLINLGASYLMSTISSMNFGQNSLDATGIGSVSNHALSMGEWYPIASSDDSLVSENTDLHLSMAMKCLRGGNLSGFVDSVHSVRKQAIEHLASAARETTSDLNPLIVKLQMAQVLSETWDLKWDESVTNPTESHLHSGLDNQIQSLNELWKSRERTAGKGWRFSLEMPLKDLRCEILRLLNHGELQAECLLDIAICARKSNRNGQAFGALSRFRQFLTLTRENWRNKYTAVESVWRIEEVKTLWAQNQLEAAVWTLFALSTKTERTANNSIQVSYMNSLLAKWMAITQRDSSSRILQALQENSEELLKLSQVLPESSAKACRVHYRMASYADHLCKEIRAKKSSIDWERSKSIMDKKEKQKKDLEAEIMAERNNPAKRQRKASQTSTARLQSSLRKLQTTIEEDQEAFDLADQNEEQCERLAINGYCLALQSGNHYDLPAMFRIVDIWLSHASETPRSKELNRCFRRKLEQIPSHKLIPLSHQLASRLGDGASSTADGSNFQSNLQSTLLRMTRDHPFHMLPVIFALKNGERTVDNHTHSGQTGGWVFESNKGRIDAACNLIDQIKSLNNRYRSIIHEMQIATDGYIDIAMIPVDRRATEMAFPAGIRRKFCRDLINIPILSIDVPLDMTLEYKDLPKIHSIDEKMTFPGGINKPKLVSITDSHGKKRRQLVKGGQDDLRQDAVMQQFFRICNAFLREAKSTAARNLSMRTYNAIPFSPSSGLLEWIDNTTSFFHFVIDGNSAYYKRLGGIQHMLARAQEFQNTSDKLNIFKQCLAKCGEPRMRNVFLRRYPDPGSWYAARLAYTRSVAVNSMAGHIIGLGDRHTSNILLDKSTAEVIHIDLGIAFEQGKLLPTPEQVPFRLTRNMVDGMGSTGVEGVMRRCCEETLRVLKKQKEPLLTVLSVFIHDPLYKWALTYDRASKKQEEDEQPLVSTMVTDLQGNVDANRTLLVIQQKLEGIVGGDTTARGVEGHVQYLLQEAQDEANLCKMWRGWMAFL